MFSSSTLIRLDKNAFEGHMCQTVNNFVKQDKSSLLSPLRKRRPPQLIKHVRNTRVSRIPTLCNSDIVGCQIRGFVASKWIYHPSIFIICDGWEIMLQFRLQMVQCVQDFGGDFLIFWSRFATTFHQMISVFMLQWWCFLKELEDLSLVNLIFQINRREM